MNQEKHFIVDILFVLALFGVFTVSSLMLVTIGSEVYRHTVDDMSHNYESRTAVAYVTEKVRQHDSSMDSSEAESISISSLAGEPSLMLTQDINGNMYSTHLYLHEGYLKELFMKSGSYLGDNTLSAGQNIMELSDFTMQEISDNLLSLQLTTPEAETHCIYISTRCTP